ncbi:MAG: DUF2240 family protein [Halobacteriales archaeon]|nr:DUF2240 family protein [Halobacteriales archaeon]
MSELRRVVAFAFRRKGKEAMPRNEFKYLLSLDLNWYPPQQAAQLAERAVQAGLLTQEGEELRLAFDTGQVELPMGFRGSEAALREPLDAAQRTEADPLLQERAQAWRAMAKGLLAEDAALLLAARERGRDVRAEAQRLLEQRMRPGHSP